MQKKLKSDSGGIIRKGTGGLIKSKVRVAGGLKNRTRACSPLGTQVVFSLLPGRLLGVFVSFYLALVQLSLFPGLHGVRWLLLLLSSVNIREESRKIPRFLV